MQLTLHRLADVLLHTYSSEENEQVLNRLTWWSRNQEVGGSNSHTDEKFLFPRGLRLFTETLSLIPMASLPRA